MTREASFRQVSQISSMIDLGDLLADGGHTLVIKLVDQLEVGAIGEITGKTRYLPERHIDRFVPFTAEELEHHKIAIIDALRRDAWAAEDGGEDAG